MLLGTYPVSGGAGRCPLFPVDKKRVLLDLLDRLDAGDLQANDEGWGFLAGALWSFGSYTKEELEIDL